MPKWQGISTLPKAGVFQHHFSTDPAAFLCPPPSPVAHPPLPHPGKPALLGCGLGRKSRGVSSNQLAGRCTCDPGLECGGEVIHRWHPCHPALRAGASPQAPFPPVCHGLKSSDWSSVLEWAGGPCMPSRSGSSHLQELIFMRSPGPSSSKPRVSRESKEFLDRIAHRRRGR